VQVNELQSHTVRLMFPS